MTRSVPLYGIARGLPDRPLPECDRTMWFKRGATDGGSNAI
jgi:hypothetical protein